MKNTTLFYKIIYGIFAFMLCAVIFIGNQGSISTYALSQTEFDQTSVLDDLQGSTVNGKHFNLADYPKNPYGKPQAVTFVEYCYSFYANGFENYGLYLYVYNPAIINLAQDSVLNTISIAVGFDENNIPNRYEKFKLQFCSVSTEPNYYKMFYKFKVVDTDNRIVNAIKDYATNNNGVRRYHIGGFELLTVGKTNTDDYAVGRTFEYRGFAKGYGDSENFPLEYSSYDLDYLTLDVHSTYYRPNGNNGTENRQDTLHSVYFSVPNSVVNKYEAMTAIHATWLNAYTAPVFVTGNIDVYYALFPYIAQDIGDYNGMTYSFVANFYTSALVWSSISEYSGDFAFNWGQFGFVQDFSRRIQQLDYLFYATNDNADTYDLSSSDIKAWLNYYTEKYGGELVNDKYSKALFESVDDSFTDVTIKADETYSLTNAKINKTWWDKLLNRPGTIEYSTTYDGIEAIYTVSSSDFSGTKVQNSDNLYISLADYDDFKSFYDTATQKDETVYLFRFDVSETYSAEVTQIKLPWNNIYYGTADKVDTNAYLAQEWVQLDFDIIDITFTNDGVDTVIPVVSNPIDVIAGIPHPVETTPENPDWWKIILGLIALILFVVLLAPILPFIIQALIFIITLPFKLLGAMFKGVRKAFKQRK